MKHTSTPSKLCAVKSDRVAAQLSSNPIACCTKCGATAHDPASLCSPVPINESP